MKTLLLFTLLLLSQTFSWSQVVVLNGVYQGNDLYVQNPFSADGVGFCVFEVLVNGDVTSDEINSSAFAVDLSIFDFEIGDPVEVTLRTKESCDLKIINPDAISPRSTFAMESIALTSDGSLTWTAKDESGPLPYFVEQFKWNKWVKVGEVMGEGKPASSSYTFKANLHHGENMLRVRQKDSDGDHVSDIALAMSDSPEVSLLSTKVSTAIEFSHETQYEVFSEYGELVATGFGTQVDLKTMDKGVYYVNFGSQFGQVVQKK